VLSPHEQKPKIRHEGAETQLQHTAPKFTEMFVAVARKVDVDKDRSNAETAAGIMLQVGMEERNLDGISLSKRHSSPRLS